MGRDRQPLLARRLGGDPGQRLVDAPAAVVDHPLDLLLGRGVDHDHGIESLGHPGFGQQGDVVDDQSVGGAPRLRSRR